MQQITVLCEQRAYPHPTHNCVSFSYPKHLAPFEIKKKPPRHFCFAQLNSPAFGPPARARATAVYIYLHATMKRSRAKEKRRKKENIRQQYRPARRPADDGT